MRPTYSSKAEAKVRTPSKAKAPAFHRVQPDVQLKTLPAVRPGHNAIASESTAQRVTVYVLELAGGKFYVGKTTRTNVEERFAEHQSGQGSVWTQRYQPLRVAEVKHHANPFDEATTTFEYMRRYGIENVRGGIYSRAELLPSDVETINREIRSSMDDCLVCGRGGHFAAQCPVQRKAVDTSILECLRCGRVGHEEETCFAKTHVNGTNWCLRCGREGHNEGSCYARTHIDGGGLSLTHAYVPVVEPNCLRCGRDGHGEETCYAKRHVNGSNWCLRCGREGHSEASCYARTDAEGYAL